MTSSICNGIALLPKLPPTSSTNNAIMVGRQPSRAAATATSASIHTLYTETFSLDSLFLTIVQSGSKHWVFKRSFFFGFRQLQHHFADHLPTANSSSESAWILGTCPFCFVDGSLDPMARAHTWPSKVHLGKHVNKTHVLRLCEVPPCPMCWVPFDDISKLIRHLDTYHNIKLALRGGLKQGQWDGRFDNLLVWKSGKGAKWEFIDFWTHNRHRTQSDEPQRLILPTKL